MDLKTKQVKIELAQEFSELFNPEWRHIVYYGGRGSLKSHSVARALLIRGRQSKLRILCTRELQKSIKDSVHKLLSDLIAQYELWDYEILKDSIKNTVTGTEFIFLGLRLNVLEVKSLEGIDICWVEEAQAITDDSIGVLTPTIRKPGSQIIWTFNRINELDPVYVKFVMNKPPNTFAMKVNYDIALREGWFPDVLKQEMESDRENPALFAHKWLGEPIAQSETSILNRDDVLGAMQREIEGDGQVIFGVDVARMGSDRTVFWARKGLKTISHKVFHQLRTTEICDQLERFVEKVVPSDDNEEQDHWKQRLRKLQVKVDDTGVGGGVTDEMLKRGYNVIAINFGGKAKDDNKYPNLISEAWFEFGDNLKEMQLPMNSDLLMELTTRQWKQDNKGKRKVEPKDEYKKRGFNSPDLADACIICYYTPKVRTTRTFENKPSIFSL